MNIAHCTNIYGKDLKELDVVLSHENYAVTFIAEICLFNEENKLTAYPFGWCELDTQDWQSSVKKTTSGRVIDAGKWYVKIGVVKHIWQAYL